MNTTTQQTATTAGEYSREFTAYATAHGRNPADQLAHDKNRFPGGCMAGFICWMSTGLAGFRHAHPEACMGHAAF